MLTNFGSMWGGGGCVENSQKRMLTSLGNLIFKKLSFVYKEAFFTEDANHYRETKKHQ